MNQDILQTHANMSAWELAGHAPFRSQHARAKVCSSRGGQNLGLRAARDTFASI